MMLNLIASILCCLFTASAQASECPAYDKVNVFIGSSGFAYGYGGVSPAGMSLM